MATVPEDILPLLDAIDAGSLVLSPNHRWAVQLLDWYGSYRQNAGLSPVCPSPPVFPVDIWIRRECEALVNAGSPLLPQETLLEPAHESLVWQHILGKTETGSKLLNPAATARTVQESWTLVRHWKIQRQELQSHTIFSTGQSHDDLAAFLEWTAGFETFCQKKRLTTLVSLLEQMIPLVGAGQIPLPNTVILAGFRFPPPLYADLLSVIEQAGTNTSRFQLPANEPETRLCGFAHADAELHAAANWAKVKADDNPGGRIGIIVPDLHRQRAKVQRIFSRVFSPRESLSLQPASKLPFSVSTGSSLADSPLVQSALLFLARNHEETDTLESCRFLRSPFLRGAAAEEFARGQLEFRLRERNDPVVTNSDLKYFAGRENSDTYAPDLSGSLKDFDLARGLSTRRFRTSREWAELFQQQLDILGWPGERPMSDSETRALEAWHQVLADFIRLAPAFGTLGLEEALPLLRNLAEKTSLRHAGAHARIEILAPVEADGLQFSHCWMTGLSEQQWPPPPRPSPFIPYSLQKARGIPEADIGRYTDAMKELLAGFRAGTTHESVFSYPGHDGDIPLKPAAMLKIFPGEHEKHFQHDILQTLHPLVRPLASAIPLELLEDGPSVPLLESEAPGGGTALVADQADCPFRAYVKHRLRTRPLEKVVPGLTARAAGSLVHLVLELFWKRLGSQAALLDGSEETLVNLADEVITEAIRDTRRRHPHTMTEAFCALEQARLRDLLLQWLEQERKRGSFTVLAGEQDSAWEHAGLKLSLRIDRVDLEADGSLVLVDYKTGRSTSVDWEDARPANPQLMLYCLSARQQAGGLLASGPVSGVFFAQVNIENTRYRGLSRTPGTYPGSGVEELNGRHNGLSGEASWDSLLADWETSLGALAEEFLNGFALVDPKSVGSCTHCFARPVCRIDEVIEP